MFKSVFAKYLSAFAVIIFVSFLMLAVIIGSMIATYSSETKKEDLSWAVELSRFWLERKYTYSDEKAYLENAGEDGSVLAARLDSYPANRGSLSLVITATDGTVIATNDKMKPLMSKKITSDYLKETEKGETETYLTDLSGLLGEKMYVCVSSFGNGEGTTLGYVCIFASATSEQALISSMTKTVVMASLWIMLAAMIAVYFISDRMVSPLRGMIVAAKEFAKGNFDARVEITSKDEIGELADAFNQMAESLDHLEMMRNSFLANVSHDLRTPMTTISGFIDGIRSGAIPPDQEDHYLGIISGEVHRLSRLVEQLLNVSRLESGERKFTIVNFDICEMARLILISFEQKIDDKRLEVEFDAEEESICVSADRDAIHQVLYNLCDNAIKFSREGGVFRISLHREGSTVTVSVYNEGCGISKEDLSMIFDRFYKTDKSRGLDKRGFGLGLYIAKTIVDAHGQHIYAESEEGKWCRFTFTLKRGVDELPARVVEI